MFGFLAEVVSREILKDCVIVVCVYFIDDPKNDHLRELEGAKERLILCRADLLDYEGLKEAIKGCDGVFHTASPVSTSDVPVSSLSLLNLFALRFLFGLREKVRNIFLYNI